MIRSFSFFVLLGATLTSNGVEYAIKLKDQNSIELVGTKHVLEKWPNAIVEFLENQIVFHMPIGQSVVFDTEMNNEGVGSPEKITGNSSQIIVHIYCIGFDSNFDR